MQLSRLDEGYTRTVHSMQSIYKRIQSLRIHTIKPQLRLHYSEVTEWQNLDYVTDEATPGEVSGW